jgi:hypothetical protein
MRDRASWLRLLGGMWLGVGVLAMLWGVLALLASFSLPLAVAWVPTPRGLWASFRLSPWLESTAIAGGLYGVVVGAALIRRRSWAQTVLVPAHGLVALYAVTVWVAAHLSLMAGTASWTARPTLVFLPLILLNAGLALGLSSGRATEALAWQSQRTALMVPTRCEFCGSLLDPETQRCPQCDLAPSLADADALPPRARLSSMTDGEVFWLSPVRATRIGRNLGEVGISLSNPTVSRQHAQIEYGEGHYILTALHDSNGTFINGTLVRRRALRDGDEVRFGRAPFRFEIAESERDDGQDA